MVDTFIIQMIISILEINFSLFSLEIMGLRDVEDSKMIKAFINQPLAGFYRCDH